MRLIRKLLFVFIAILTLLISHNFANAKTGHIDYEEIVIDGVTYKRTITEFQKIEPSNGSTYNDLGDAYNYDLDIMNGDIGHIKHIDEELITAIISFPDGREVEFKRNDLLEIKLAYCISIHKSQGSEIDCVIIPIMRGHYRMLYKQLLYTGVTRGKKLVVFVGERRAFSMAIKNDKPTIRQTSFKELLS